MRVHIVQKGDTLWKIAKQYAIGFEELKRLNAHLANPDYIVPGMEIYLPDGSPKKEKEVRQQPMVKEQPQPQTVKEQPIQTPAPTPAPVPVPVQPQRPMWQGDVYFQPAPQPQPMPLPNWQQTHVHFQPTFEQTMTMPAQQMPQMMPQQPIIIQQPAPAPAPVPAPQPQQPIFIEHPAMMPQYVPQMHPQMMPQMQPMPVCHHCQSVMATEHLQMHPQMMPQMMPQMQPMPVCQHCQGMMMWIQQDNKFSHALRSYLIAQYQIGKSPFAPYLAIEMFTWDKWQKTRHYVGTEIKVSEHSSFDIAYMYYTFANKPAEHLIVGGFHLKW